MKSKKVDEFITIEEKFDRKGSDLWNKYRFIFQEFETMRSFENCIFKVNLR